MTINGSVAAVLEGFTIRLGNAYAGGAIHCLNASPTIRNNVLETNTGTLGSAIYCEGSTPTIENNTIRNNTYDIWTGLGLGGAVYCVNSTPVVKENIIYNNTAAYGGALAFDNSDGEIRDNRIEQNNAGDSTLMSGLGGAIYLVSSSPLISGNRLIQNDATALYDFACGGAIYCYDSSPVIKETVIIGNNCSCPMGTAMGGGICCSTNSSPLITHCEIAANVSNSSGNMGYGGGLYCTASSHAAVKNCVIAKNYATHLAGGFGSYDSTPTLVNNIIFSNNSGNWGGGLDLWSSQAGVAPIVTNNTIVGNSGATGGGIRCDVCTPVITNTIIWGNTAPTGQQISLFSSTPSITYCDVEGGFSGTGNIDADPLFLDMADDDLHLTFPSPCRGAGDNTAVTDSTDFEGDPRIVQGRVDIGADEFYYHLYQTGSVQPGGPVEVKVVGIPGLSTLLGMGSGIQDPPSSTQHGHLWLTLPLAKSLNLGSIPSTGILAFQGTVPLSWRPGEQYPFQALAGPWGGSTTRLTNLMVLEVD